MTPDEITEEMEFRKQFRSFGSIDEKLEFIAVKVYKLEKQCPACVPSGTSRRTVGWATGISAVVSAIITTLTNLATVGKP